jgi:hypothetical protein
MTRIASELGGVLGPIAAPVALVLGRHDQRGQLRVVGLVRVRADLRPEDVNHEVVGRDRGSFVLQDPRSACHQGDPDRLRCRWR